MANPVFGRTSHRFLVAALSVLALVFVSSAAMASVAVDAISTNAGDAGSFTHSHTVGAGSNRLLTVAVSLDCGESVQSVAYGGTPLLQQSAITNPTGKPRVELWRLVDPPTGTADVVVTLNGGTSDKTAIGAISFTGVDQSSPIDDVNAKSGTTTAISANIHSRSDDLVCDILTSLAAGDPNCNPGQTERWNLEMGGGGASGHYGAGSTQSGGNLVTMSWTAAEASKEWAIIAYNVRASACTDNLGDRFMSIAYDGNDGTRNFTTDWTESGESDSYNAGVLQVVNSAQCPSGNCFRIGAIGAGATDVSITRQANLDGATTASLSYKYRRDSDVGYDAGSGIVVEVSDDGGASWDNLQTLGIGSDATINTVNHDIGDYIAANTQVRISTNAAAYIDGYAYFDDIIITHDCIEATGGNVYYVSSTGDDGQDGSSVAKAWESINRGDELGILEPGDTINILPGVYTVASTIILTTSGTSADPIVYRKHGDGTAEFNMGGLNDSLIEIDANHILLSGLTLKNCDRDAVTLDGDSCLLTDLEITDFGLQGIDIRGSGNTILRNVIYDAGESGIVIRAGAENNLVYGNTVYWAPLDGVWVDNTVTSTRIFNNLFVAVDDGIEGPAGNVCGFNGLWACNDYYSGGVSDSAGGIIADPEFVDAASGDFTLLATSPAIDTALDLGYDYIGDAPEMGAEEYGNPAPVLEAIGPQVTVENASLDVNVSASDDASIPTLTISALPTGAAFVDNGDGTGAFDWTPTYLQSGVYQVVFYAADNLSAVDSEVVSITVTDAGNQSPVLAAIGSQSVDEGELLTIAATASDAESTPALTTSALPSGASFTDNADGTADFSWTPSFAQAGDYDITFYATDDSAAVDSEIVTITVNDMSNQPPVLDPIGSKTVMETDLLAFSLSATDPEDTPSLTSSTLPTGAALVDNGDGTADFSWTPSFGQAGDYEITFYAIDDSSAVDSEVVAIEVTSALNTIRIVDEAGDEIGDLTLSADNDTTEFFCRAYKSGNGNLGYLVVDWSVIGADGIGTVSPSQDSVTTLTLTNAGTGRLVVTHSSGKADTTGVITCIGGSPAAIVVSPTSTSLAVDSTEQFAAQSLDADGNLSVPGVAPTWSTTGAVGSIDATGLFTATSVGSGSVIATSAGLADTASVTVSSTPADSIEITPDTATVSADSTLQFIATGFTESGTEVDEGTITWSVVGAIGTIDGSGQFEPTTVGSGRIAAVSSFGPADTSGTITVTPGDLATLTVAPDSVSTWIDSMATFSVTGHDDDGNETSTGTITWSVVGGVGTISIAGVFTATDAGSGRIAAASDIGGIVDTNRAIVVQSNDIASISVSPDTATVVQGDSLQFIATALTAGNAEVADPDVSWGVLGSIGAIDGDGLLHASTPGYGRVVASAGGAADTTNLIAVMTLVSGIPLGSSYAGALQGDVPLLAFRVSNYLDYEIKITELTVRDCGSGFGSSDQIRSNIASLKLYLDRDDDSTISDADQLLDESPAGNSATAFAAGSVTISALDGANFIVAADIAAHPTDSDTLDLWLRPSSDITTSDGTVLVGPDSLNSSGVVIIDGLLASQIDIVGEGAQTIDPAKTVHRILTLDLPPNGYRTDTLNLFSVINLGTAEASDVDTMILYRDNGDGAWSGGSSEIRVANMVFTGQRWVASGLSEPLTEVANRYHVAVVLGDYPVNGATFSLGIPLNGIDMASQNDGPIDAAISPVDTIAIVAYDAVAVRAAAIDAPTLRPGQLSAPVAGFSLTNTYGHVVAVDGITCRLLATDADGANQEQLDSQIDSVVLYANLDGDFATVGQSDSIITTSSVNDGQVAFSTPGLSLPSSGGSLQFAIAAGINLMGAKNGNTINFGMTDSTDITVADSIGVSGDFPLSNSEAAVIDIFPAAAVTINSLSSENLYGGQLNRPVLDFELPRNGYTADILNALRIFNDGTLDQSLAIDRLVLWADLNDNGYSSGDTRLGEFTYSGGYWRLSSIDHPLTQSSNRLIVTADLSGDQFQGGTIQYMIPVGGVAYASGARGPDDAVVGPEEARLVFPSDRITVISIPSESRTVAPGSSGLTVLAFALYNGYITDARTLTSIRLANASRTAVNSADYALGQVALYADTDGDRDPAGEDVIATGRFQDGTLNLTGLDISLPPDSLSYFFVQADIPLNQSDSDSLTVRVTAASDFGFSEPSNVNGDLPLTAGGYQIIDGSVAAQYSFANLPSQTIAPGDIGKVVAAFHPATNGGQNDLLTGISISNAANATAADFDDLHLWIDQNGNYAVDAGDTDLGSLTYDGSLWNIAGLNVTVASSPPTLLVVADVADAATPGHVFQAGIPLDGCQYSSANNGPRDQSVTSGSAMMISNSTLQISHQSLTGGVSLGDTIDISITVRNLSLADIDDVTVELTAIDAPSLVSFAEADTGPIGLDSGESAVFVWRYVAVDVGSLSWYFRAVAESIPDTSATLRVGPVDIRQAPAAAVLAFYNSIPTAVTRGQTNVFPMSLGLAHSDTLSSLAGLRLDSLTISVEDESGNPVEADALFARVAVSSGYTTLAVIDSPESSSEIALPFNSPVIVRPGHQTLLSVLIDIADSAEVGRFRLAIAETEAVPVVDENSRQPVPIESEFDFPLRTAACRIDIPSTEIAVSGDGTLPPVVNYGQDGVGAMRIALYHPGESGSSPVQLTGLTFGLQDSLGQSLVAAEMCDEVHLSRDGVVVGYVGKSQLYSDTVSVDLSAPVTLHAGETGTVDLRLSVDSNAVSSSFRVSIADSTALVARDLSSGSELHVITDTLRLATGTAFPMTSNLASLKKPALPVTICAASEAPSSVVAGSDSISLLSLVFTYDATSDHSSVRLPSVTVDLLDSLGYPLSAASILDRIGWRLNGGTADYQPVDPYSMGAVWNTGDTGLLITPGASITLNLLADIDRDAVSDHFVMNLDSAGIEILDATDTTGTPPITSSLSCEETLPLISSPVELILPAGRPIFEHQTGTVRLVTPGQRGVVLLAAELDYSSAEAQGDVIVESLRAGLLTRTRSGYYPADASTLFSSVCWLMDADTIAVDTMPAGDSIVLDARTEFTMTRNEARALTIQADLSASAPIGNYLLTLADSTFLTALDDNLLTPVWPQVGKAYPIRSAEVSVGAGTLEESFVNYPNPFNPDIDGPTKIGFTLENDARIDIELFTITGERIAVIVEDEYRAAGNHSSDSWNGRNNTGQMVMPGTYFCRITARYSNGTCDEFRRKVALVR